MKDSKQTKEFNFHVMSTSLNLYSLNVEEKKWHEIGRGYITEYEKKSIDEDLMIVFGVQTKKKKVTKLIRFKLSYFENKNSDFAKSIYVSDVIKDNDLEKVLERIQKVLGKKVYQDIKSTLNELEDGAKEQLEYED